MPKIILSWTALIWIVLSVLSLVVSLISWITSTWLLRMDTVETRLLAECPPLKAPNEAMEGFEELGGQIVSSAIPSIGPWLRCQLGCPTTALGRNKRIADVTTLSTTRCQFALWGFGDQPAAANAFAWTASFLGFCGCFFLMCASVLVVFSLCKRDIFNYSLLCCTGSLQGLAGKTCSIIKAMYFLRFE